MVTAIILILVLGAISIVTTTSESRAEARAKFDRWNPLWISLIVAQLAFMFWPR